MGSLLNLRPPEQSGTLDEEEGGVPERQAHVRRILREAASSEDVPVALAGASVTKDGHVFTSAILVEREFVPDIVSALMDLCGRLAAFAAEDDETADVVH